MCPKRATPFTILLLAALTACSNGIHRPPNAAVPTSPPEFTSLDAQPSGKPGGSGGKEEPVAAPSFQKVAPEENTALIKAEDLVTSAEVGPYRLAVDDQVEISVYGEPDLQRVLVPVRPDGMISFAFVGDVAAAGRTVEALRQEITQRLAQYLRSPQVFVLAKQFAQKKVYLGGEVKNPGVVYLGGREGTLVDALYKAGLTTDKADLEDAYVMRGNKVVAADFKALVRGDLTTNIPLSDEDVIFVPENVNRYVYVLGEVRSDTAVEVTHPIPIVQALAKAGGFTNVAKRKEIAIIRGGLKNPEVAYVNAKALEMGDLNQNIMVNPGDIIYVATTGLGKYNNFVDQILKSLSFLFQGSIVRRDIVIGP